MQYLEGQIITNTLGKENMPDIKKRMFLILKIQYLKQKPHLFTLKCLLPDTGLMVVDVEMLEQELKSDDYKIITLSKNKEPREIINVEEIPKFCPYEKGQKFTLSVKLTSVEKFNNKTLVGYMFAEGTLTDVAYTDGKQLPESTLYSISWEFDYKKFNFEEYYYADELEKLITKKTVSLKVQDDE